MNIRYYRLARKGDEVIGNNSSVTSDLIGEFKLPIYYLSAKVLDEKEMKLKSFEPLSVERDP